MVSRLFDYVLIEDSSYVGESYGGSREIYLHHGLSTPRQDPSIVAALLVTFVLTATAPLASAHHSPFSLDHFREAVGQVESGGRYDAENPTSGAYGKYQIMPANWPSWAGQYLGDRNAPWTPALPWMCSRRE